MEYKPAAKMPIRVPAIIYLQPRYKPAAAMSFMSPPPNAPFIIRDIISIGTDKQTAPIKWLEILPKDIVSVAKKLMTARTAIKMTIRSGTMPLLISADAHATSSNKNMVVNIPRTLRPQT